MENKNVDIIYIPKNLKNNYKIYTYQNHRKMEPDEDQVSHNNTPDLNVKPVNTIVIMNNNNYTNK